MTTPASSEPMERCADCLRPKATDSQDYYKSAYFPEVTPSDRKCPAHLGEAYRYDCHELTIARLRSELASVRALSEAERAVVECVIAERKACNEVPELALEHSRIFPGAAWWEAHRRLECAHYETERAVDALLALRKDQTDGD